MQIILDETSLVPCPVRSPHERIRSLADTVRAFDQLGFERGILCSDALREQPIHEGMPLSHWIFQPGRNRSATSWLAQRLTMQSKIGRPGLAEIIKSHVRDIEAEEAQQEPGPQRVVGLWAAALSQSPAVILTSEQRPRGDCAVFEHITLSPTGEITSREQSVQTYGTEEDVQACEGSLRTLVIASLKTRQRSLEAFGVIFSNLRFGPQAQQQILETPHLPLLLSHLEALHQAAYVWQPGQPFKPAVESSHESKATLRHPRYAQERSFPPPAGFPQPIWSEHTKFSNGLRLYYSWEQTRRLVLIGYFGPHLSTVNFR